MHHHLRTVSNWRKARKNYDQTSWRPQLTSTRCLKVVWRLCRCVELFLDHPDINQQRICRSAVVLQGVLMNPSLMVFAERLASATSQPGEGGLSIYL